MNRREMPRDVTILDRTECVMATDCPLHKHKNGAALCILYYSMGALLLLYYSWSAP